MKLLSPVLVAICLCIFSVPVSAQSSAKAAWGFEETAGTTAADGSSNGNDGTIFGATWAAGRFGGGLSFDGNDRVQVVASESMQLANALTISAWIKFGVQPVWRSVLAKESDNTTPSYSITFDGASRLKAYLRLPDGVHTVGLLSSLPVGAWHHIAVTYDGTMIRLFVNGEQRATDWGSGNVIANDNPLRIGGDQWGDNFTGVIDEVRLYDRALSVEELSNDMTLPVNPAVPLQAAAFTPASGAVGIRNTPLTATFTAAMNATTLTASTLVLEAVAGGVVTTNRSYDSATRRVTITPATALSALTAYRLTVIGGSTGVASATGTTLSSDVTWTFATAAANGASASWGFEEGTGAVAADSTGNGNTGTLLNGPTWTTGPIGNALSFDGINDRVNVPFADTLNITNALTASAWINLTSQPTWRAVLAKEWPNSASFQLSFDGGNILHGYIHFPSGMRPVELTAPLALNQWTHVAMTYDGSNIRLYIDGVERDVEPATGSIHHQHPPLLDRWQSVGRVLPRCDRRSAPLRSRADASRDSRPGDAGESGARCANGICRTQVRATTRFRGSRSLMMNRGRYSSYLEPGRYSGAR